MPAATTLELKLEDTLQQDTDQAIITMVEEVVQACSDRNEDLYLLRAQNEGVSQPGVNGPWPNSCIIEHPVTREYHLTAHANIMAALRQKPYVTLEALNPADDERVQRVETMLNTEADLFGFDMAMNEAVYTALESRFCVTGIFYKQVPTKQKRLFTPPAPFPELEEGYGQEAGDNPAQYTPLPPLEDPEGPGQPPQTPVLVNELNITESIEFQHYDPWDFYVSPAGVETVGEAEHVFVRQYKTREALLQGIITEEYDRDAVMEILRGGPTHYDDNSPRADMESLEGIEDSAPGFYECFMVIGRMPYLMDGDEARVPQRLMHEDFLWMVCPQRGKVFKRTFSPFPIRPFALGNAIKVPGRLYGHGVVSLLSSLQDEMTAIIRAMIDSVNLTMNPMLKVPNNLIGHYSKWQGQPGRYLPYMRDPGEVVPLSYDLEGLKIAFEMLGMIDNLAAQLSAAQGVNSMLGGKVRKAAEVEFTGQVVQNKFALFLMNMQKWVEEVFRIYVATRLWHLQDKVQVRSGNESVDVTEQDLSTQFRIIPHANAENASAEQRMARDQFVRQIMGTSPIAQARIAAGIYDSQYKLDEMSLAHAGVNNPQAFLGQPPVPGSPEAILTTVFQMLQMAAPKDPVVAQILQRTQALNQEGAGSVQVPNPVAGAGMTLPALPDGNASTAGAMANGTGSQGPDNGVGGGYSGY